MLGLGLGLSVAPMLGLGLMVSVDGLGWDLGFRVKVEG